MLITSFWYLDTILLTIFTVYLLLKYLSRNYDYWKQKGIPYVEPVPVFGNVYEIATFKETSGGHLSNLYFQMANEPFFGMFVFDKPYLVIRSPELIRQILVKDFKYFFDRAIYAGDHEEITKAMPFFIKNPEWKLIRTKITPVFTSGKMKKMFPLIKDKGEELQSYIRAQLLHQPYTEVKEICAKYATDVITKCAFAIDAKSFENEEAEFRTVGRKIFSFTWRNAISQTAHFFTPTLAHIFKMNFIPAKVNKFLADVFWQTLEIRERSGTKGNDVIDVIIDLKKNKEFCEEADFRGDKVVAQAAQFFTAGFDTTSSVMAFTLYELSLQPEIQNRVREEIKSTLEADGEFTYDNIISMKYLHMCVCETLRKYPVLPFLDRICNTDYKIPDTDIIIEKGTPIFIPMFGLHYDPKYFPNPEKYDPERFSDENLPNIVPFSYIPFGEGPRICIGERFGLLGTKLGLVYILSEFVVEKVPQTPNPVEFETRSILVASKVGLPMKFSSPNAKKCNL